jgi:hypothetical protein
LKECTFSSNVALRRGIPSRNPSLSPAILSIKKEKRRAEQKIKN